MQKYWGKNVIINSFGICHTVNALPNTFTHIAGWNKHERNLNTMTGFKTKLGMIPLEPA